MYINLKSNLYNQQTSLIIQVKLKAGVQWQSLYAKTLGDATQIEMILSVSHHPGWPRQEMILSVDIRKTSHVYLKNE
jgi:hypothetical protein